ncbi:hypothetical protein [Flavobacterium restrictum]|uniref:DUF2946 domain-containing protein n=1 Tax=Flavobacterium restrictum TaxID=2594428 RepID=A0A553DVD4_9FLAO|nr:hypothetical protein [Flavobacterium restrictum]TRX36721.1 hypothetical protein FNW21_13115 [Flavobacterium restrictum]
MKKKQLIANLFFAIILLFSIVFQSFHGYEHHEKQLSQKICYHKQSQKAELTHQHKGFDHCFVCEFTFGSYLLPDVFSYPVATTSHKTPYFFATKEAVLSFSGSLYSLRGPPESSI